MMIKNINVIMMMIIQAKDVEGFFKEAAKLLEVLRALIDEFGTLDVSGSQVNPIVTSAVYLELQNKLTLVKMDIDTSVSEEVRRAQALERMSQARESGAIDIAVQLLTKMLVGNLSFYILYIIFLCI